MRIGLMVPHFGEHCSRERIVQSAVEAEAAGFRSFWVRDHLLWEPHGSENQNRTFIEPFVTLSAIAAVTQHSAVGTSVVIPVRWPLKLAQNFAALSFINNGRVIAGIGIGRNPVEFSAAGLNAEQREAIFRDTAKILPLAWNSDDASFVGEIFSFEHVQILPKPVEPIPLVYGGKSPAAVRRAVDHTDGWNPGGLPLKSLQSRLDYMKRYAGEERAASIYKIIQPQVSIDKDRRKAEERVPFQEMLRASEGSRFYEAPTERGFQTIADLAGLVACGTPDEIVEQLATIASFGVDEVILDLRLQFDRFEEAVELLGADVLPQLGGVLEST